MFWGFGNPLDSAIRRHFVKNDFASTWFLAATRLPIILILLLAVPIQIPNAVAVLGMLLGGVFWIWPFILYYKAIEFEEPSRIALLLQMTNIFVLLLAMIFLGERLTVVQFSAFGILLAAGILASIRHKIGKWHISKALGLILLASLLWAFADILFKKFEPAFANFPSAIIFYLLGSFLPALGAIFVPQSGNTLRKNFSHIPARGWWILIIDQVVSISGTICFAYALTLGKASLTAVVLSVQTLFALGFGLILSRFIVEVEREDVGKKNLLIKGASFFLMMLGLFLLNFSHG